MLNIRTRLTLQFMGLVTAVLLLFSVGVFVFSKLYLEKRFFKRLQDRAVAASTLLFELTDTNSRINLTDQEPLPDETISVYSEKLGRLIFSTNPTRDNSHAPFIPKLKSARKQLYLRDGDTQLLAVHLVARGSGNWVLISGIDRNGLAALADLQRILLVMVAVGALLLSLAGWVFAGQALAPMSGIIRQVNTIFPANVARRVDYANPDDEIGTLVETFNRLLDRVEQTLVTQKIFVANVSHELKNPLTKIRSQIDVALLKERPSAVYQDTLGSLRDDIGSLTELTNTLLSLASVGIDGQSLPMASVRLDELLWAVKMQVQKWQPDYRIELAFPDFPDDEAALLVHGNEAALKILLINLFDNACKFSADQTAQVTFRATGLVIRVDVVNAGAGIPAADLPHIFKPFYRSNATASSRPGHGVGLAIVAQVVQLHQGTIAVESTADRTAFRLELPVAPENGV
ncbi:HAMP domain-containing sensor histidine kinase [Spirosoma luteolum]